MSELLPLSNKIQPLSPAYDDKPIDYVKDLFTSIPQAGLKTLGGIVNNIEAFERLLLDYELDLRGFTPEEKAERVKYLEENPGEFSNLTKGDENIFTTASKYFDQFDIKSDKAITEELDIKDPSTWGRAGARAVIAGMESWPSIAAAFMGAPAMIALGVSYAGNKFEEELAKDPTKSVGELFLNAQGTGAIEAGFEMATRGLFKYAGLIGTGGNVKIAKDVVKGGFIEISKRLLGGFVAEGASEAATELTNNWWDSVSIEGREMPTFSQMQYQLGDAFLVGGVVGGTISGVGEIAKMGETAKNRANITLMPLEEVKKVKENSLKIKDLLTDRARVKSEKVRNKIDQQVTFLQARNQRILDKNFKSLQNMSKENLKDYATNVTEINTLIKEINENPGNKTVKSLNEQTIRLLSEQNKNLLDESAQDITGRQLDSVETLIDKAKQRGITVNVETGDNDAMQKFAEARNQDADVKGSTKYGGFVPVYDADKNLVSLDLFINTKNSIKNGFLNTAAHEFFHAAIFSTVGQDINAQMSLGNGLLRALTAKKATLKEGSDLNERIKSYDPSEGQGVEILALTVEALKNNEINLNEGFIQDLRDVWRRFGQKHLKFEIRFDKDQDVLNFVKDFIKTVDDPSKIDKAMLDLIQKGAKGKLLDIAEGKQADTEAFSKEASDNVQRLYEEKGRNFEQNIIEQFKPIVGRIAEKRRGAPNFDKELLMSEIEIGERGILDLIKEYKPDSGVPLAAYINKFLPTRAIEASRRVLGEEFTEDVTEARNITDEPSPTTKKKEVSKEKLESVAIALEQMGHGNIMSKLRDIYNKNVKDVSRLKTYKDVKNAIYRAKKEGPFYQALVEVSSIFTNNNFTKEELAKRILTKQDLTTEMRKAIQNKILKNSPEMITMVPDGTSVDGDATGIANTKLGVWYDKGGRLTFAKTGTGKGLAVQQKKALNNKAFLTPFGLAVKGQRVTDKSVDGALREWVMQVSTLAMNQASRQVNPNLKGLEKGKNIFQFSKDSEKAIKDLALNTDKLVPNDKLANRTEQYLETIEDGVVKGEVITRKHLNELQDEKNKVTWEEFYMNQLLDFFESYSQYYNVMQSALTGGVKKAAFFNKPYFDAAIKRYAKKNNKKNVLNKITKTKQIKPLRLYYHKNTKWKGLDNLDLSKDDGKLDFLLNFFNDISKHVSKTGNGKEIFQEVLTHFGIDQSNFMRHAAKVIGHPVDPETGNEYEITETENKNPIGVEEHAVQMEMARIMMGMAFDGNIKDAAKLLKAVYSQISLRKIEDPSGEYRQSMGKDFYDKVVPRILDGSLDFLPDGYASIYRLMKAGVNPFGYKLINEKQTIAEYFGVNNLSIKEAQQAIIDVFEGNQDIKVLRANKASLNKDINKIKTIDKAVSKARTMSFSKEAKGITVLDFDDTLATTKSLVKFTRPDGATGTLNAEQYAKTYEDLLDQGFTFDFSDFNKVVKGKLAPLFNKALKLQKKFGPENMFVLTARPPAAQKPIFDFLKANGLNIPLKNITGLGNSTSEAKALWIAGKVGEGYNDFYFADDALQNVQAVDNMLEQFDVKRKVQQAKLQFSKDLDGDFNSILQDVVGIKKEKRYSQAKARKRGQGKGRFRAFVPPSHEDFIGLLYNFIGKGDEGNKHRDFFEKALVKPLNRAYSELNTAKQSIANDYRALIKAFPDVRKKLTKKTPDGDYYYSDAVRVYLWDKAGFDIPGMSKTDVQELVDLVTGDSGLQAFADNIGTISRQEQGYVEPNEHWETGDIRTDLTDATGRVGRKKFFAEFIENSDIIFSKENLNKIEAAYGLNFREALEDILHRTKNGTNRTVGQNKIVNRFLDYINGSIGATMFFNARSAVLQTISTVNFINFGDNNIFAASRAFANQKQFWSDFSMLFNSDMLKQRRAGVAFDVNASEIANAVSKSKEPVRAAIRHLLQMGFLPTQIADSFAISLGGAAMYRNRVNTYLKQGLKQKEAEKKAFSDFQEISESTQQSARPDKISQQQASPLGRMILAFQNTPSQYVRLMKKAGLDLINRRKTPPYDSQAKSDMSNISKIIYYGAVQNIIFYGLQSALFAMLFEDDEKDEKFFKNKRDRILNGSLDTILRGMGVGGAVISTIKNTAIAYAENQKKTWNKEDNIIMKELLQLSPPIGIKAQKLGSYEKTMDINKKVIEEMSVLDIDNPIYSAVSNLIEATTNVPLNRLHRKTMNLREAANAENEWWQRLAMALGWSRWDVGVKNEEVEAIREEIKSRNKKKNKGFQGFRSKKTLKPL